MVGVNTRRWAKFNLPRKLMFKLNNKKIMKSEEKGSKKQTLNNLIPIN